jgi:hypothetical protein
MGCGLIMLGGKNSFGAGGWAGTNLEAAMPVDFQIKNSKVHAIGALAMVMHASEMAEGNYWQKVIAREALKVLGPFDYCGVIHWGFSGEEWLWGNNGQGLIRIGQNKPQMLARLDRMTPGDMPEFESSLRLAAAGFSAITNAAVKHMIIISDGDPTPPQFQGGALSQLKKLGVQVTTVAVGTHGDPVTTPLKNISIMTGGKYYVVKSAKALPRIFQREARRVSKPLIVEQVIQPTVIAGHEILNNIEATPPISGFVMTTIKKNPLVEVLMQSPLPAEADNATILATWTYGIGRVAALTTDCGARWSNSWTSWSEYDKFFGQLIRWTMRPNQDNGQYAVSTEIDNGKVKIVVDVLQAPDDVRDDFSGSILDPQLVSKPLSLRRIAPSRYQTEFPTTSDGSYFITVRPNAQSAPLRVGVNVPYSSEYRYQPANDPLLRFLASPIEGPSIGYIHAVPLERENIPQIVQHDTFRRDLQPSMSSRQIWPWMLVFSSYIFFADILTRRLALDFHAWRNRLLRIWANWRNPTSHDGQTLESLRRTKAAITEKLERRKSTTHFEPTKEEQTAGDMAEPLDNLEAPIKTTPTKPPAAEHSTSPIPEPQESFTSRLLRAKKNVQKDRPPQDPGATSS